MPSGSWRQWNSIRSRELDQIEAAHAGVGGTGPGRRHTTQQINRAYVVLLASQFQGFCRDLHSECVNYLVAPIVLVDLREAVKADWTSNRQLDKGNAHSGSIAGDFGRLGVEGFWSKVDAVNSGNLVRRQVLDLMNHWRNAIAHQDLSDLPRLGGSTVLRLKAVRRWRRSCQWLARALDIVMREHIRAVTGVFPW